MASYFYNNLVKAGQAMVGQAMVGQAMVAKRETFEDNNLAIKAFRRSKKVQSKWIV